VRAMDSGVLDAARSSMSIFGYEAPPHAEAVRTLIVIISGVDSMGKARQHRAADAGAIDAIIRSLTKRSAMAGAGVGQSAMTGAWAKARYRALRNLTRNNAELAQLALDAGAHPEWL
jgi:hypothetical protein